MTAYEDALALIDRLATLTPAQPRKTALATEREPAIPAKAR